MDESGQSGSGALRARLRNTTLVSALLAANKVGCEALGAALLIACDENNVELTSMLLAAGAEVNLVRKTPPWTPLWTAIRHGNAELVSVLLAAGAEVNQVARPGPGAMNRVLTNQVYGWTPLLAALTNLTFPTEIVSMLLEAGAAVDQAKDRETPLFTAIVKGQTDCAMLLSSYGASRSFSTDRLDIFLNPDARQTASSQAAHYGHADLAAWFVNSSQWTTPLHHLTIIGATRTRALLRAGADLEAAAEADGGTTPLSLARALQQAGEAGEDTAAGLVLNAAKPWSQQTHALFPAAARARAVELMLLGHRLSRESVQWGPSFVGAEVSLFDAWMVGVLPQAVQRKCHIGS